MDPSFSNCYFSLGDSGDNPNTQYYENSTLFSNPSQVLVSENLPTSQNTEKQPRGNKWDVAEDVALMSALCIVSENNILGKNQKKASLWSQIKELYDAAQAENLEKLGKRNVEQMKGRYKRLNENAQKWVGAYREAHRQLKSGMSQKDVESEAHKYYEQQVGSKFNDSIVFNEVMCKSPKWELQVNRETTHSRPEREVDNDESGGSTKRSRTTEEGDYSNPETPNNGGSTVQRPIGRDAAKAKRKGKVSNELAEEVRAMRLTRDSEVELLKKKLNFEQQKEQFDNIMCELLISMPNMFVGDQHSRARRRYCDREREQGETCLMKDYFVENPTYDQTTFRRRFRMQKPLFLRIVDAVTTNDRYFQQRRDATGRKGLSPLQKCTGAIRVSAYGTSADAHDEYLRMSETVTRDVVTKFVEGVISCFSHEYLRRPNDDDLARLLHVGVERGFPGMIGSIDCMHWEWRNCPSAWAGQYAGRSGKPTIILEAVASYDLWIWHAFFGTPGSCNDINVLQRSPIFDDVLSGRAPNVSYVVNGREYNRTYYLTDGIYPSWAAFVKSITSPQLRKHKLFAQHQEAVRKDVERAFGVLQARFAFLRHPCLVWDKDMMGKIMIACIILHNMIVEDERDTYLHYYDPSEFLNDRPTNQRRRGYIADDEQPFQYSNEQIADLSSYMTNRAQLRNRETHNTLKNDLIEHIWQKFSHDE